MIIWRTNQSLSDGLYTEMLESIQSNHKNKNKFYTTFYDENNLDIFGKLVPFYGTFEVVDVLPIHYILKL